MFPADTKVITLEYESQWKYTAELRLKCKSKEEFQVWLKDFQEKSNTTYRIYSTKPRIGKKVLYKATYRCQHNTYPSYHKVKTPSEKHTGCVTKLNVTVKAFVEGRRNRSKDNLITDYPTVVNIYAQHNHNIDVAASVKFKDTSEEIRKKFIELFKGQHAPPRALEIHKRDLLEEYEEEYYKINSDRSICPDLQWVYRLYYSCFKKEFSETTGDFLESLKNMVEKCNFVKSKMKVIGDNFVIALCSPLMERVHSLSRSSETVFIDSSGNMDRYNCRVFLLMIDSCVGGLPLGVLISSCETEDIITTGLQLLKDVVPSVAFGGAGAKGPASFLTDDSMAQQNSLKTVFPESSIWLCSFHVLQAVWRWLWNSSHDIFQDDRRELYMLFKNILVSTDEANFNHSVEAFRSNETAQKYNKFCEYVEKYLSRANSWCLFFRPNSKGNNTNNIVESAVRVLKDKILNRSRAYNVQQLFVYLAQTLPDYYSQKIIDIISGRMQTINKYFPSKKKLADLKIVEECEDMYKVKNIKSNNEYQVNPTVGFCSCPIGNCGAPCKHQHFVAIEKDKFCPNIIPLNMEEKIRYHYIAVGNTDIDKNWYAPLLLEKNAAVSDNFNESKSNEAKLEMYNTDSNDRPEEQAEELEQGLNAQETGVKWEDGERKWNEMMEILKEKFEKNPTEILHAIDRMHVKFTNIKTDSSLVSAMCSFGQTQHESIKAGRKSTYIPVQPTAIGRRTYVTGARKCQRSGRPAKRAYVPEHGYGKRKKVLNNMPFKSQKAPHSLQECVDRNISLGK